MVGLTTLTYAHALRLAVYIYTGISRAHNDTNYINTCLVSWIQCLCSFTLSFFCQVVDVSDVVLEVLDARDPLGCRCPQVRLTIIEQFTVFFKAKQKF